MSIVSGALEGFAVIIMFAQVINQRRKLVSINAKVNKVIAILLPIFLLMSGKEIAEILSSF